VQSFLNLLLREVKTMITQKHSFITKAGRIAWGSAKYQGAVAKK
jgi:hypothetical protein